LPRRFEQGAGIRRIGRDVGWLALQEPVELLARRGVNLQHREPTTPSTPGALSALGETASRRNCADSRGARARVPLVPAVVSLRNGVDHARGTPAHQNAHVTTGGTRAIRL